jgi:hypothetical protein
VQIVGGSVKKTAKIGFHSQFVKPTACDLCCINAPSSSPTGVVARSQLPLETILGVQISQNTRGGFDLHFRKKFAKKGWFMFLLPIFVHSCLISAHFGSRVSPCEREEYIS